jgi:hypothetical protein
VRLIHLRELNVRTEEGGLYAENKYSSDKSTVNEHVADTSKSYRHGSKQCFQNTDRKSD